MKDDEMLYCLIAFILGWLISRMMGDGFSVGGLTSGYKFPDDYWLPPPNKKIRNCYWEDMSTATDNNCEKISHYDGMGGDCGNYYEDTLTPPKEGKYVVCEKNEGWEIIGGDDNYCKRSNWSTCQIPPTTVEDDWTLSDILR